MTWQLCIVVALFALNIIGAPFVIGPREDFTPGRAAFTTLLSVLMIVLIFWGSGSSR